MRVLLDECIDQRLVEYLQQFDVRTVVGEGWAGISNGKLLEPAQTRFDVFVTVDRNLSFQQHLPKFSVAVVLVTAPSNRLADLLRCVPQLVSAIRAAAKGVVTTVAAAG